MTLWSGPSRLCVAQVFAKDDFAVLFIRASGNCIATHGWHHVSGLEHSTRGELSSCVYYRFICSLQYPVLVFQKPLNIIFNCCNFYKYNYILFSCNFIFNLRRIRNSNEILHLFKSSKKKTWDYHLGNVNIWIIHQIPTIYIWE